MKTSFLAATCIVTLVVSSHSWAVTFGPGALPPFVDDAQMRVGWVFDDPKTPEGSGFAPGWDNPIGDPVWDYESGRTFGPDPAQWYIRLQNVIDTLPVKHFWLSYVYERDNTYESTRTFTNIDWYPVTGMDNFTYGGEWFDASGNPTTDPYAGVYGRLTMSLDMFPNPDYEDLWIGLAGSEPSPGNDGFDLLEVYVLSQSIPEPATVVLLAICTVLLCGRLGRIEA